MRIALVCRVYPTHRPGGMPFVVQDRARALAALGHEVHVLTTGRPGAKLEMDEQVFVHYLPCPPQRYSETFAGHCSMWVFANFPDVVHLDSFDLAYPWWNEMTIRSCVRAVTLHGFGFGAWLTKLNLFRANEDEKPPLPDVAGFDAEAKALARFDVVIGISRHEHWMLRDVYGLFNAKLVYNPIAPFFFEPSNLKPKGYWLCAAISGHAERGFHLAQQAAEMANVPVRMLDNCDRRSMPAEIDASLGLIVPTFYSQGYDLTVAEAFARGRPVIASATGSYLREQERHEDSYFGVVPRNDPVALASEMRRLAGAEVPREASSEFTPEAHAKAWLAAIGA